MSGLENIDPAVLGVELVQIGTAWPNAAHIVACRLALEEIDRLAQERRDHIDVTQAFADAICRGRANRRRHPAGRIEPCIEYPPGRTA